jgi:hypothetical protein
MMTIEIEWGQKETGQTFAAFKLRLEPAFFWALLQAALLLADQLKPIK